LVAPLGHNLPAADNTGLPAGLRSPYFVVLGTIEPRKNHLTLLALWRQRPDNLHEAMGATIDDFRMQVKGAGAGAPKAPRRPAPPLRPTSMVAPPPTVEVPPPTPIPPPPAAHPAPSFSRGRPVREPVGGGPRQRGRTRAECPKCHSMGVVLARSYAGDEYFSCIYCGWQAYKAADENDPTASLAMKLLGHSLPEK
ncbi:MAG: hypothetical protein ACO3JL_14435, partial [Myxococcota bacterium]